MKPDRDTSMATQDGLDNLDATVVECSLCGESGNRVLFTHHGFEYQRCRGCGLVRVNPQLTPASVERIYRAGYEHKKNATPAPPAVHPEQVRVLDQLERLCGAKGRLLDVGCFEGRFIWTARELGWNVAGTEISQQAVSHARNEWGLDVQLGRLVDLSFKPDSFDAIVLLDVIEHLPDPMGAMLEVGRLLRPGGALYLWTPNFGCITRRVVGRRWGAVVFPWHLYYFTGVTLKRIVSDAGLQPVSCSTRNLLLDLRDPYVALREHRPLAPRSRAARRINRVLDDAMRPVFDWTDRRGRHWGAQMELFASKVGGGP